MTAQVIYDSTGKVWNVIYGEEQKLSGLQCMTLDLEDGTVLDRIDVTDLNNPVPVVSWPVTEAERSEQQYTALVESIRRRVTAGEDLRKIIGSLDLSDSEKWALEATVKEAL